MLWKGKSFCVRGEEYVHRVRQPAQCHTAVRAGTRERAQTSDLESVPFQHRIMILIFKSMKILLTLGCGLGTVVSTFAITVRLVYCLQCYLKWPQMAKSEGEQLIKRLLRKDLRLSVFQVMKSRAFSDSAQISSPFKLLILSYL